VPKVEGLLVRGERFLPLAALGGEAGRGGGRPGQLRLLLLPRPPGPVPLRDGPLALGFDQDQADAESPCPEDQGRRRNAPASDPPEQTRFVGGGQVGHGDLLGDQRTPPVGEASYISVRESAVARTE
jgi:hypothetical protein